MRLDAGQALRFAVVVVTATLSHIAVAVLVVEAAGAPILSANLAAFATALAVYYTGNYRWAVRAGGDHGRIIPQFATIAISGLVLNQAIVWVMANLGGLDYRLALAVVVCVVPALNFAMSRVWVFRGRGRAARRALRVATAAANGPGQGAAGIDAAGVATFVAFASLVAGSAWLALSTTLNHDSGWYLHATKVLLNGGRLYVDIVEINPPLAFVLTVPPVWFAEATGSSAIDAFFLWIFGLIGLSLLLSWGALRQLPGLGLATRRVLMLAAFLALVLAAWGQIGQREHFAVIFGLPYLFLAAAPSSGGSVDRRLATLVGTVAALGFALKPHFLLVPVVLELYRLKQTRRLAGSLRPETVTLGLLVAGYWLSVALLTPTYFTHIVPWAMEVYRAYSAELLAVLWCDETLLLLGVLVVYLSLRQRSPQRRVADVFFIAAACFYVVYVLQMKGFRYHVIPVRAALLVVLAACMLVPPQATRIRWLWSAGALIMLGTASVWLATEGAYKNYFLERALPLIQRHAGHGPIYIFSTNVWQAFPLANYARLESASRFSTLWLLPGTLRELDRLGPDGDASRRRKLRAIERYLVGAVVEDFQRHAPGLVLVDVRSRKSYFGDRSFDYIAYFSRDPRFARIWSRYRRLADVDDFDFHLYRRGGADR